MLIWRWRGVFKVTPQDWISPRKARRWGREEEAEHQPFSRISSPQVLRTCGSIITTTNPGLWPESPIQPFSMSAPKSIAWPYRAELQPHVGQTYTNLDPISPPQPGGCPCAVSPNPKKLERHAAA